MLGWKLFCYSAPFRVLGRRCRISEEKPLDSHCPDLDDPSTYSVVQGLFKSIEELTENTSISLAVTPQRL